MSSNTLELVAKFKDNASQGLRRLLTESQRAATGQARVWAQAGRQRQQAISAYQRLGIRSEQQIRREMQLTQAAYNRLARSGTLSQRELARAAEANRRNLQRLNNELRSGAGAAGSWRQRLGGAMTTVAAAGVGAYTVLKPSMDNQKQLEANISQVAWQAFGEDNSKTSDWIATTGKQQIRDLVTELVAKNGGNADAALNLINSQMANGMSFEQVQKGATATYRAMIASAEGAGQYDPESVAKLMKVLHDFGFQGEELATAFEHAMKSGMQGNFEIADMVTELPALLPAAKNSGLNGIQGFDYLLSILQSASNKSGSNSEAANNVRNLLEKTLSADTVKRLSRMDNPNDPSKGVDWANSVLQGKANGENAVQVLSRLANTMLERDQQYQQLKAKADAGDQTAAEQMNIMRGFVLSRILPDIQAKAGLLAASDVQQVQEYIQGLAGIDPKAIAMVLCIKAQNSLDDVVMWIKAYGKVTNAGVLDAATLAAGLQNKSDKGHTHRAAEINDFAEAVAALTVHQKIGTFDICKLPDGTQIESGTVRIQNHNNNPTARVLTWPLAFVDAPVVVATMSAPEGNVRDIWVTIDNRQSNQSAVHYWLHEPVYNTPDVTVNFVAIGRWK